ncbi:MAG: restriction endonuclease subunit S [Candidatus Margulisbacteria bacterium]|jgi:hypothetical protein|nr:restriction endonuclease subunit S [Candidatus Margulisiibacteriota bacterium]
MKNKIDTSNWQNFNLADLFEIKGTKTTPLIELQEYGAGRFPFVTTQATNNGVEGYYNFSTEKGGVLTVDSAVLGFCSYQDADFSASDHVEKLTPKFNMTKNIAMFLVTIMNREQYRYNYGRKASQERLKARSIKLPAKNNQPDWDFMEKFIDTHTHSYSYAKRPAKNIPIPRLTVDAWKYYELGELFDVKYGVNLELINLEKTVRSDKYAIRFVSRTENNNGLSAFVKKQIDIEPNPAGTLSIACGGSVLAAFLQNKEYYSGRDIYCLKPKQKLSDEVLLFISVLIRREKYRFNYGRQANKSLRTLRIKLPAKNANIDCNFMTKFVQALPFSSQI